MCEDKRRRVIAMVDCADGNESVGTEWVVAAIFKPDCTLTQVFEWASQVPHRTLNMVKIVKESR